MVILRGLAELRAKRRESRLALIAVFVFSVFVNLLMLTAPLYMLQVYDRVLGSRSVETLLALSLNLVRNNVISTGRMLELLASNPPRILGLNAAHIAVGQEADLILIDPDAPWQVDGDRMAALAGNTPFDRLPVQGRVRHMLKGGKVI